MANFSDLVTILRSLHSRVIHSGRITGALLVDTQEKLASLRACADDFDNTALSITHPGDEDEIEIGVDVQVEIETPRPGFGLLCENLSSLLRYPSAHVKEPKSFYLLASDFAKNDPVSSGSIIDRYQAILAFVEMLKACAAFLDEKQELLVFVKNGKFEVPVKYDETAVAAADISLLKHLSQIITNGVHEKQQLSIMAESVYEISVKYPPEKRFVALIDNAADLKERFEKGYTLFASGFSYEKIRDEIEAARVEFTGKIHKVFSDIQNQLLSIPIATIIVATQMKESTSINSNFWTNTAILVGSFVFMILMHLLIRNQKHTLDVIGLEIKRQKKILEKQHAAIAPNFTETFDSLKKRFRSQKSIMNVIDCVVIVGFVLSVFFYYKLNTPVQEWLINLLSFNYCKGYDLTIKSFFF